MCKQMGVAVFQIKLYLKDRRWAIFGTWTIACWPQSQMITSRNDNSAMQGIAQWGDYVLQISWEVPDWSTMLSKADWTHRKPPSWGLRCRAWAVETVCDCSLPRCSWQDIHGSPCFLQVQPVGASFLPVSGSFLETQPGDEFMVPLAHLLVAVFAIFSSLLREGTGFPPNLLHPQNPHKESHTFHFWHAFLLSPPSAFWLSQHFPSLRINCGMCQDCFFF